MVFVESAVRWKVIRWVILLTLLCACATNSETGYSRLLLEKEIKPKLISDLPIEFRFFRIENDSIAFYFRLEPSDFLAIRDSSENWFRKWSVQLKIQNNQFSYKTLFDNKTKFICWNDDNHLDSMHFTIPLEKDVYYEVQILDENKHVYKLYTGHIEGKSMGLEEDFAVISDSLNQVCVSNFIGSAPIHFRKNKDISGPFEMEVYTGLFTPAKKMYLDLPERESKSTLPDTTFTGDLETLRRIVNGTTRNTYFRLFSSQQKEAKFGFSKLINQPIFQMEALTYLLNGESDENEPVGVHSWQKFWFKAAENNPLKAEQLMKEFSRRMDFANDYFGSYKEGWQTDRGMLYILLGPPERIVIDVRGEIWLYGFQDIHANQFTFYSAYSELHRKDLVLERHYGYREVHHSGILQWENGWIKMTNY